MKFQRFRKNVSVKNLIFQMKKNVNVTVGKIHKLLLERYNVV